MNINIYNTSLNKSQAWQMVPPIKNPYDFYKVLTFNVKIWAQSDYYFTNYSNLSETTVVNF